jgi:putative MATE family efflux protein
MATPVTPPAAPPLWRRFLLFLAPLVLTNVLQALSGTLNNIYLGQMLGTQAMAAAASFFPLLMFFVAFVIGLGAGTSVLAGQAWGARDLDKLRQIAGTSLLGGALLGAAIGLVGILGIGSVLQWLGTPADVLPEATHYARVMLLGLPALFVFMLSAGLLRGTGDTVTPLRTLLVSCAVSMALTPLLIRFGGLGPASAAWANVAASLAGLAWLAWYLARKKHPVAPAALRGQFRLRRELLGTTARLGIPTGLFFVTGSLADIALLSLVNGHGSQATAAWGVVTQVMAYVLFPAMSIAIASTVFTAQAIGARQLGQLREVARVGLTLNLVLTGLLAVLVSTLGSWAARLFVSDPGVIALAASLLHITVWGSVLLGLASVFSGMMRAAGTVRVPTLISLGCICFLMYPVGWLCHRQWGIQGIFVAYPVTYAVGLALQAAYFYGVFRRKPIRQLV